MAITYRELFAAITEEQMDQPVMVLDVDGDYHSINGTEVEEWSDGDRFFITH